MDAREPILSIGVACYNVERYLERGCQSYADARLRGRVEVLLVDDGSQDATSEICDRYARQEPQIFRAIHQENAGHGGAVNAAIGAARGRYFRVIDGDDWVDTEELVRLVSILESLSCDLVIDQKTEVDMATGERQLFPLPPDARTGESQPFDVLVGDAQLIPSIMIHTLTMRTDMLRAAGVRLREHTFYVDLELVVKATLAARDACFCDTSVYQYLVGNAQQSVADQGYVRHFDDHTRVCHEVLGLLDTAGDLSEQRRAYLLNRCVLLANTHYNIALIFDPDRKRGMRRAKDFRAWLKRFHPEVEQLTAKRYALGKVLHYAGVRSQADLDRLTRRG